MGTLGFQGRFYRRLPDLLRRPHGKAGDIVVGDGAGHLLLLLLLFLGGTRTRTRKRAPFAGVLLPAVRATAASVARRRSLAPDADGGLGSRRSGSDSPLLVRACLMQLTVRETPVLVSHSATRWVSIYNYR